MAEQYEPGIQRIFYRAWKFATGLTVTVQLIHFIGLDINKSAIIPLYEVDVSQFPGLYCFEYPFLVGNYVAYFYEGGKRSTLQAYSIRDSKLKDIKADIEFIKQIEGGRWRIINNQMIFYKDDNKTKVATFDLFDSNGKPTMLNVVERRRKD